MPTVEASKIKIRRGTNAERQLVILETGELGYTTDTKRTYIGDGETKGGNITGNKNFNNANRTDASIANKCEIGDLVFDNNLLYSLTASNALLTDSWMNLGTKVDGTTIQYNADNILSIVPGSLQLASVGNGLRLNASGEPAIYLNPNTDTSTFLYFDSSTQLSVGNLTNTSHGNLTSFRSLATAGQHHANVTTSTPGFMHSNAFQKLCAIPTFPIASVADANLLTTGINNYASTRLNGGVIDGSSLSDIQFSNSTSSVKRYTSPSDISFLSGGELTTPYYFINREDFPGTVFDTAIPESFISNTGAFANFKIQSICTVDLTTTNEGTYMDKAFILPGGNGRNYAFFISQSASDTAFQTFKGTYTQLSTVKIDFAYTASTLKSNIINAINNNFDFNGRVFDAWDSGNDILIQCNVRGNTPVYDDDFAKGEDPNVYAIQDTNVSYTNSDTYEAKTGTGRSAGDLGRGSIPASLYGWLVLDTSATSLSARGKFAIHTVDNFTVKSSLTDGSYFLIYDAHYNRTCVYFDITGSATEPNISNNIQHKGFITNFIKVDLTSGTFGSTTDVANEVLTSLTNNAYFTSVYDTTYDSGTNTMTFISKIPGYTDGIVNRKTVGLGSGFGVTPNIEEGSPNVERLNSAFFNSYKLASTSIFPQKEIVIPGKSRQTLIADDTNTVDVVSILKFR